MSDGREFESLQHARRLAAPSRNPRDSQLPATELYSDEGRAPMHVGLASKVEQLREGLSVTIEVQLRTEHWRRLASAALSDAARWRARASWMLLGAVAASLTALGFAALALVAALVVVGR